MRYCYVKNFCFLFLLCFICSVEVKSQTNETSQVVISQVALSGSTNPSGPFRFEGSDFLLNGLLRDGNVHPSGCCFSNGSPISLGSQFSGELSIAPGAAQINGMSYSQLYYEGSMSFVTPITVVPFATAVNHTFIVIPFTFTATLKGCTTNPFINGCPQGYVFDRTFTGKGKARLHLKNPNRIMNGNRKLFQFDRVTYTFDDLTSEPNNQ